MEIAAQHRASDSRLAGFSALRIRYKLCQIEDFGENLCTSYGRGVDKNNGWGERERERERARERARVFNRNITTNYKSTENNNNQTAWDDKTCQDDKILDLSISM